MRFTHSLVLATLSGSCLAANCFRDNGQDILSSDIEIAIDDVDSGNIKNVVFPFKVKASSFFRITRGGAILSISNHFLFDNTHVSQTDVVSAARNIRDECGKFGQASLYWTF